MRRLALAFFALLALSGTALGQTAILLPNGKQQFLDSNGNPLAIGSVFMYVPTTTTPKTTWVDPFRASANANPIVLDAAGEAIIYGAGNYRQVVKDSLGNTIWDQLTQGWQTPGTAVVQVISATGTYTPTAGMLFAKIECVGGGGGGGGAANGVGDSAGGGGGGAGSYSMLVASAATIGASQVATVGVGGTGGTGNANGAAGGDTILGALCIGKGGGGGGKSAASIGNGGVGGIAGTGTLTVPGNPGGAGIFSSTITVIVSSGVGGASFFGGAGRAIIASGAADGLAATGYGSGGSGALTYATAATATGGVGFAGVIVITEFLP